MRRTRRLHVAMAIAVVAFGMAWITPVAQGALVGSTVATGVFPIGVWVQEDRTIFMSAGGADRVYRFDPGSTVPVTIAGTFSPGSGPGELNEPRGIHVLPDGTFYVADSLNHRVQMFAPGATEGVTVAGGNGQGSAANQLDRPRELFVDELGNVYVADTYNDRVQRWAPGAVEGETVAGGNGRGVGDDQFWLATGVHVDDLGNIFVADYGNERIMRWAPGDAVGTQVIGPPNGGLTEVQNFTITPDGSVYVVDSLERVWRFAAGATIGEIIAGGNGAGPAPNQFSFALDVAVHSSGDVYVADANNGRIQLWEEGVPHPDLIRVTTDPPLPSDVVIDGLSRDTWSLEWLTLPAGEHQFCFTDVPGFETPPCETINTTPAATTTVTGVFTPLASLQVQTSPPVPATISVDGVPMNEWGMWTDVVPGLREVCFGAVEGYTAPPCEQHNLVPGANPVVVGVYTIGSDAAPVGHGLLRVTTSPPVPSRIFVDGIRRDAWALTWLKIDPGTHEVCFSDVHGFETPACETVEVVEGATATVEGVFEQRGQIRVSIDGSGLPTTISIDGVPRDDWGVWTFVPLGLREVCFSEVGGVAPPCVTADVVATEIRHVTVRWPAF